VLQTLILRCGDFAPTIVGIVRAYSQLLDPFVVLSAQTIYRVGGKVAVGARLLDPFKRGFTGR
jgi:hypothetical protein